MVPRTLAEPSTPGKDWTTALASMLSGSMPPPELAPNSNGVSMREGGRSNGMNG